MSLWEHVAAIFFWLFKMVGLLEHVAAFFLSDYSFKYGNGDVIICDFCPFRKYVTFEKVGKREKVTIPLAGSI